MALSIAVSVVVFLIGGAGAAAVARAGWIQRRRRMELARVAHEMGLQFAEDDPFDIPRRYAGFLLPGAGHSPRARNVIHGHFGGWQVRAFDYRFEIGHGTRRLARRYGVMVADADADFAPVLLWHEADHEHRPLGARSPGRCVGPWRVLEGEDSADALGEAFSAFADERASLQARGRSLLLCRPGWPAPGDFVERMRRMTAGLDALTGQPSGRGPQPSTRTGQAIDSPPPV